MLRIVSWNVESLARLLGDDDEGVSAVAKRLGADVLCLQEVRVRPIDTERVAAMRAAAPGFTCHASLARDPLNARFRGGRAHGVATYVSERLGPAREVVPEWDREGRVVISELAALDMVVVDVYAVNGTAKPYFDPETGVERGDRHEHKRRFMERLLDTLRPYVDRGVRLVLAGDWNVSRTRLDTCPRLRTEPPHALARALFNDRFIPLLDVVDIWRELHPEERGYTWFRKNARYLDAARVDAMLVSRGLVKNVTRAEILGDDLDRRGSDHAPITLDLDLGG